MSHIAVRQVCCLVLILVKTEENVPKIKKHKQSWVLVHCDCNNTSSELAENYL